MGKASKSSANKVPAAKKPTNKAPRPTAKAPTSGSSAERRSRRARKQPSRVTARPTQNGKGRRPTLAENFRGKSGGRASSGAKSAQGNLARREGVSELRTTSQSKASRLRRS
ncbi:hypothetical protein [Photobacterium sp. DNB22_13_2]